jgi:propionyl-CoA carboxylase beta chain
VDGKVRCHRNKKIGKRCADRGFVDAIIQPRETPKKLIQALAMLENKRDKNPPKKHGNIPL